MNMLIIKSISNIHKEELDFLVEDYIKLMPYLCEKNDIEIGRMAKASIYPKPIVKFYKLRLSENNFEKKSCMAEE